MRTMLGRAHAGKDIGVGGVVSVAPGHCTGEHGCLKVKGGGA